MAVDFGTKAGNDRFAVLGEGVIGHCRCEEERLRFAGFVDQDVTKEDFIADLLKSFIAFRKTK